MLRSFGEMPFCEASAREAARMSTRPWWHRRRGWLRGQHQRRTRRSSARAWPGRPAGRAYGRRRGRREQREQCVAVAGGDVPGLAVDGDGLVDLAGTVGSEARGLGLLERLVLVAQGGEFRLVRPAWRLSALRSASALVARAVVSARRRAVSSCLVWRSRRSRAASSLFWSDMLAPAPSLLDGGSSSSSAEWCSTSCSAMAASMSARTALKTSSQVW